SVMFQFTRKGVITVDATGEEALLQVLEAGARDAEEESGEIIVYTDPKDLSKTRQSILDAGLTVKDAELHYVANNPITIDDPESATKVVRIMNLLDDLDDVVNVH